AAWIAQSGDGRGVSHRMFAASESQGRAWRPSPAIRPQVPGAAIAGSFGAHGKYGLQPSLVCQSDPTKLTLVQYGYGASVSSWVSSSWSPASNATRSIAYLRHSSRPVRTM